MNYNYLAIQLQGSDKLQSFIVYLVEALVKTIGVLERVGRKAS